MSVIDTRALQEVIDLNLVKVKTCAEYPGLRVLKYRPEVEFDILWGRYPVLRDCRGLVVDSDLQVVSLPFRKQFNYGVATIDRDAACTAVRKMNGFMASLSYHNTLGPIVGTTGTLDSPFALLARQWLRDVSVGPGLTLLFEICDPTDPHIIVEAPGAYLIGARNHRTGQLKPESWLDDFAIRAGIARPAWFEGRFSDIVRSVVDVEHEGYMVYDTDGNCVKLKSPYYQLLKRICRMRYSKLVLTLSDDRLQQMMPYVKGPVWRLLPHLQANIDDFCWLPEQGRLTYCRNYLSATRQV